MRQYLLFIVFFCCYQMIYAQTSINKHSNNIDNTKYYSYTPNGKVVYAVSTKKIIVKFQDGLDFQKLAGIVSRYTILHKLDASMILPSPRVAILEFKQDGIDEQMVSTLLEQLNILDEVVYANPFLVYADGSLQGITETFFVKLKSLNDLNLLKEEAITHRFKIKQAYSYDRLLYFLEVDKNSDGNALELANKLYESNKFVSAEPDFLLLLKKFNTNDPYLNYQWGLHNTGSSIQYSGTIGADMNIFNAWGLSTGNANTKVAVIDEGVDLVHPDLAANILPGFDGTGLGSGGAPSGDDAHGTACAGIIAAVGNNNLGIAGVAYSSKIVPVRIAYGSGTSWVTSNSWIGTCIDWAWDQGDADVLSNSWGGGSSSTLINDAIGRATTNGRGGLGSPVLFAAGNDNGSVSYPGYLSNVISVTAMSMCNQRKSPSSCDGESFWGSNYGTNTDVSAPGVKIYTCDISGANGYSTGDYTATFNGTSSATPNTAGVMALILAANPLLTMAQARQILESTCDKVGGYTYNSGVANQPNGTWSSDLGYGRVNAHAALLLANPQPCTNPPSVAVTNASPSNICSMSSINLTLTGITFGTGQTYQWQSSSNNTTYTNIVGATSASYTASTSTEIWYRCAVNCGVTTNSSPVHITTIPLIGGVIAGPTAVNGGIPTSYTLSGNNGSSIQWEKSTNSGSTWTNIPGATTTNPNIIFSAGVNYLRARISSLGNACPDAYSNVLVVNVASVIGDMLSNPIPAVLPFAQMYSNDANSGYTSTYTGTNQQASADIFFSFTTGPCADSIRLSSCGSNFDTYIHLLNSSGTNIASNDDNGPFCAGLSASLKVDVNPNTTYIAVFEGYSANTGNIQVEISEIGTILPTLNVTANGPTTFCAGGVVTLNVTPSAGITWNTSATTPNIVVNTSGSYYASYNAGSGCISTSNAITVIVNPLPIVSASNVSGCTGNPINLIGSPIGGVFNKPNPYTGNSTTYNYTYTNTNGCSATSNTASITVATSSINSVQTVVACQSYTWGVNGVTYTNSGLKTASFINVAGCDSVRSLQLTINASSTSSSTITSTNSYSWSVNGVTYTTTGVYTHTLSNAVGCDSILTLNLTIIPIQYGLFISPKVLLAGPYNTSTGLMYDSLRVNNLIPTTEPYSSPPLNFQQIGYAGGETVSTSILGIVGNDAIVDWIFIELRSAINPAIIIATKRGLLQRDGDVVSPLDGVSPISFPNQPIGNYYVSVKHRNHLGVMTSTPLPLGSTPTPIDFSNSNPVWLNPAIMNAPRKVEGNVRLLFVGDANTNKSIKYNGNVNDKDPILNVVGASTQNNSITAYRNEDLNLDAKVKYNSTNNDRVILLNSVGSNTPNAILFQHTPN